MPNSKIYLFAKKLSMKKSSANTHGSPGTAQTLRWSCERIILSTGHFEDLTQVELNSWPCKPIILWIGHFEVQLNS